MRLNKLSFEYNFNFNLENNQMEDKIVNYNKS